MAEERTFAVEIISPERIFYTGKAVMVELNTTEGQIGIYKDHIPTTGIIAPGILTLTEEEGKKEAALHAGFIQILQDKVVILAEAVEWPEEIDMNRAKEAKVRAERILASSDPNMNLQRAELALRRSLTRLHFDNR